MKSSRLNPKLPEVFTKIPGQPLLKGIKERKEQKDQKLKEQREQELKKALAEKCAGMGGEYVSHQEDETQYTIVTINGKTIKVRKEEIVLEGPGDI